MLRVKDSLTTTVNLITNPQLQLLQLQKSNDVDCMIGTMLTATGGRRYEWRPERANK